MEDIVYEVVGGAIILGIILIVITVFRSSADTIRNTVSNQSEIEDTSMLDTIGIDGGTYNADKIIEAWNFSKVEDMAFQVEVKNGSKSQLITSDALAQTYGSNTSVHYTLKVLYLSEKSTATSTSLPSNIKLNKGDQGIVCVRFVYTKK